MCGICGYVGAGQAATLEAMSALLSHRGPDESGIHVGEAVCLAHRRLSIIDLARGQQPMVDEDDNVLVFNGEIYNFQEIRRELERRGHRFRTCSDTEVLLRAYRQWGQDCLQRLRGMFAFALWDARRHELFLARDRVGIKPLYYAMDNGVFYFASEAKALLEIPGFRRRLNREVLPLYMTFRYTPGEDTLFEGIRKLLPGHSMVVAADASFRCQQYWSLHFEHDEGPSEAQWRERFWGTFEESVRLRMISDVPLGAYLSGGLDSSLIVAAMSGMSANSIDTFSVGFKAEKFNELPYAAEVSGCFDTHHHVLHAEEEAAGLLEQVIYHMDEPLGDLAAIPTFLMARETKPHVTVVLSGEGADELLAGYPKYRAFMAGQALSPWLPGGLLAAAARYARSITLQRVLATLSCADRVPAYLQLSSVFTPEEQGLLLAHGMQADMMNATEVEALIRPHFIGKPDGLSELLSLDFHTWLPDDLLLKNDRMTMAHGVETRVPYLDHQLVELCAQIPSRFKLRWNQEKVLLRKVTEGRLPEKIRRRRKTGFTVPLDEWMKTPFGRKVDTIFSEAFIRDQGLFDIRYISALRRKSMDQPYYRRQLWSLAALGLWQQRFEVDSEC